MDRTWRETGVKGTQVCLCSTAYRGKWRVQLGSAEKWTAGPHQASVKGALFVGFFWYERVKPCFFFFFGVFHWGDFFLSFLFYRHVRSWEEIPPKKEGNPSLDNRNKYPHWKIYPLISIPMATHNFRLFPVTFSLGHNGNQDKWRGWICPVGAQAAIQAQLVPYPFHPILGARPVEILYTWKANTPHRWTSKMQFFEFPF